jgi:hypothetical protein
MSFWVVTLFIIELDGAGDACRGEWRRGFKQHALPTHASPHFGPFGQRRRPRDEREVHCCLPKWRCGRRVLITCRFLAGAKPLGRCSAAQRTHTVAGGSTAPQDERRRGDSRRDGADGFLFGPATRARGAVFIMPPPFSPGCCGISRRLAWKERWCVDREEGVGAHTLKESVGPCLKPFLAFAKRVYKKVLARPLQIHHPFFQPLHNLAPSSFISSPHQPIVII